MSAPVTVSEVFRRAAEILSVNGHWQGDFCPDPLDRETHTPHYLRPLSIVAALRCAVSGDPHTYPPLADKAIAVLAVRIGDGPGHGDAFSLELHVDEWGDTPGRSTGETVALLLAAAGPVGRPVLVPTGVVLGREVMAA
jgi:hypothetical protein